MASLLDGMTKEQRFRFLFADLVSRNLIDEKTAEKDLQKILKKSSKKEKNKNDITFLSDNRLSA